MRQKTFDLLREDNTGHFVDAKIDGFLQEGVEFAAVFIEYPRDLVSVQAEAGIGSYANPTDNLLVRTAYFGNSALPGDIRPLKIVTEETLKEIYPSWLDATASGTSDRPEYLIQLDRHTLFAFPRPNAAGASVGKKLWLNYNYVPATMSAAGDTPDLPLPYHNLIPIYALHLCYIALQNTPLAEILYKEFMEKVNRIKSAVTKEAKELQGFTWGSDIDVEDSFGLSGINP